MKRINSASGKDKVASRFPKFVSNKIKHKMPFKMVSNTVSSKEKYRKKRKDWAL